MTGSGHNEAGGAPFSAGMVLVLVAGGFALFIALLWMIGAGLAQGSVNDGRAHVGGKGLNGYAALASLLERQGYSVSRSRRQSGLRDFGLVILTPPADADANEIRAAIAARRAIGPTMLILPKWQALPLPRQSGKPRGWVTLLEAEAPEWAGELDLTKGLDLGVDPVEAGSNRRWSGQWSGWNRAAVLAPGKSVQHFGPDRLDALIRSGDGNVLAGYAPDLPDDAVSAAAAAAALSVDLRAAPDDPDEAAAVAAEPEAAVEPAADDAYRYPVILVAEPDLLSNLGMADRERALLALALIRIAMDGEEPAVTFDLTLPGHAAGRNLLTLAFTPPFLAATLCLILAAIALGWRAFARFGPPRAGVRAIAFGKTALVSNAAGLIRRARRLHLLGGPYAAATRDRLVRALGLPASSDPAASEAAIDRALAARAPDAAPYSNRAAALRGARHARDLVRAAQDLHAAERILTR